MGQLYLSIYLPIYLSIYLYVHICENDSCIAAAPQPDSQHPPALPQP